MLLRKSKTYFSCRKRKKNKKEIEKEENDGEELLEGVKSYIINDVQIGETSKYNLLWSNIENA